MAFKNGCKFLGTSFVERQSLLFPWMYTGLYWLEPENSCKWCYVISEDMLMEGLIASAWLFGNDYTGGSQLTCKKLNYTETTTLERRCLIVPVNGSSWAFRQQSAATTRHMNKPPWMGFPAHDCNLGQHPTTIAWKTPSENYTANLIPNSWPSKSWIFDTAKSGDNTWCTKSKWDTLISRSSVDVLVLSVFSPGSQFSLICNMLCNFFIEK